MNQKNPIHLVGKLGVARVQLVGGPHDGESCVAVVGAPIILKQKFPKPEKKAEAGYSLMSIYYTVAPSYTTDGEDWKEGAAKESEAKQGRPYAVYLPPVVDGKAALYAEFVGIVEVPPSEDSK